MDNNELQAEAESWENELVPRINKVIDIIREHLDNAKDAIVRDDMENFLGELQEASRGIDVGAAIAPAATLHHFYSLARRGECSIIEGDGFTAVSTGGTMPDDVIDQIMAQEGTLTDSDIARLLEG